MQNSLFGITEQINANKTVPADGIFESLVLKTFPTLYVLDANKRLRSWEIKVEARGSIFAVVTLHGLSDGAKVPNEYIVTTGTNVGRSNEKTPYDQACFEAQSKWDAQIRAGYCENANDAKQATLGSGIPAPMLAQKYSPDGSLKGSKTLEKLSILGKKIHVQPKLDGNRCLVKINADEITLYTRKGDEFLPILHIENQLNQCYDGVFFNASEKPEIILVGELFSEEMSFNALNGLLRKENKTYEDRQKLNSVKYYIYDLISEKPYVDRLEIIKQFTNFDIITIPSYEIIATEKNIREKMNEFLAVGFEGLMMRILDSPYENKRSWSLLKYKDFQDEEYRVVDIIEDVRGTGIIGAFVLELPEPVRDRDGREIKTFNAGIKDLSHDEARKILANKFEYIGKTATIEFFEKSEYGIPRFPKLKGFRMDV